MWARSGLSRELALCIGSGPGQGSRAEVLTVWSIDDVADCLEQLAIQAEIDVIRNPPQSAGNGR